jgi:inhibitor of cysteine peptidase
MSGRGNMKILLNACLFVMMFLVSAVSCQALDLADRDNGGEFFLAPGETLTLTLSGNATTGYLWDIGPSDRKILRQEGEPVFIPDSDRIGSGGKFVFRFFAQSGGSTRLNLFYHRPWEKNIPPVKKFQIGLTVQPTDGGKQPE